MQIRYKKGKARGWHFSCPDSVPRTALGAWKTKDKAVPHFRHGMVKRDLFFFFLVTILGLVIPFHFRVSLCGRHLSAWRAPFFAWVTAEMGILEASLTLQSVLRAPAMGNREPWSLPISLQGRNPEYCLLTCHEYLRVENGISPGTGPKHKAWLRILKWGKYFLDFRAWLISCITSIPWVSLAWWNQTGDRGPRWATSFSSLKVLYNCLDSTVLIASEELVWKRKW